MPRTASPGQPPCNDIVRLRPHTLSPVGQELLLVEGAAVGAAALESYAHRMRAAGTARMRAFAGRVWEQAHLMHATRDVHAASYGTYGHRRVHAELVLGQHLQVSRGRVERLMRSTGLQGVHRRRCGAAPAATKPPPF